MLVPTPERDNPLSGISENFKFTQAAQKICNEINRANGGLDKTSPPKLYGGHVKVLPNHKGVYDYTKDEQTMQDFEPNRQDPIGEDTVNASDKHETAATICTVRVGVVAILALNKLNPFTK